MHVVNSLPDHILHTAEILLPMGASRPIHDGFVLTDSTGTIVSVGSRAELPESFDERHDHHVLMPGVLNCHVHLIDAGLESTVPGGEGLATWVQGLLAARRENGESGKSLSAIIGETIAAMKATGTVAIGEVANGYSTFAPISETGIRCRFIDEMLGFREEIAEYVMTEELAQRDAVTWPSNMHHAFASHAPYSVSLPLMRSIARESQKQGTNLYQHLAEDPAERLLYCDASGPWRSLLEQIGAWEPTWSGTGESPIALYDRLGILNDRYVGVHLADATPEEIALLASRGSSAILSPTSNIHITGLLPPFEAIVESGMKFALGTDGRGSNSNSDLFDEARLIRNHWPDLAPGILLQAMTTWGAGILGFDDLGHIASGTRPGLLALELEHASEDFGELEQSILEIPVSRRRLW